MDLPLIGELRLFSGSVPNGWANCDGQILPISSNQALFSLLGTTYGGDGRTTFALPDLRGRVAVGQGGNYPIGSAGGAAGVVLTMDQMPAHTHQALCAAGTGSAASPQNGTWAQQQIALYADAPSGNMAPMALTPTGSNQAHNNMQPYTVLNWGIALVGVFPSFN